MKSKFKNITIDENGLVTLTIHYSLLFEYDYYFHIDELRDYFYNLNTNIDKNDKIVDIKIDKHTIKNIEVYCIKIKTQDNYEEVIFEDDDFFFTNFLKK